ncbi:ABC transporter permease subunit [Herbidospora daliensis]|uniref:ABC transporter permease subunit n=1 Tax=Herbidospora daliensis TaxID=295585 RepID=UPI000782AF5B|nr:ABC transporter permease subunit [Herbidospora daliensis]
MTLRRAGFAGAVAGEWIKIWTVRSTLWSMFATVVVTVGLSSLLALAYTLSYDRLGFRARLAFDPVAYGLAGLNFGVITLGVLGVLVVSTEFSSGLMRTSLSAVPRRSRLLAAKAVVLAVVALAVGLISSFAAFFASQAVFSMRRLGVGIGDPEVLRAVTGGGLYLTLIALISLGAGAIVRHTAGAITSVLGVLFVAPIFGVFLPEDWGRTVQKFLPPAAGSAILTTRETPVTLPPWQGFGVFAGYTALVLVVAFVLFRRRDV